MKNLIPFNILLTGDQVLTNDSQDFIITMLSEQPFKIFHCTYKIYIGDLQAFRKDVTDQGIVRVSSSQGNEPNSKFPVVTGTVIPNTSQIDTKQNEMFLSPKVINPTEYLRETTRMEFDLRLQPLPEDIAEFPTSNINFAVSGMYYLAY